MCSIERKMSLMHTPMIKSGDVQVDTKFFFKRIKIGMPWCEIAKNKSQKLHVPILETNRKNLHPQKKTVFGIQKGI